MYDLNLDMLSASARHHANGRPKDIHAHHRREHLSARRAERRGIWISRFHRILGLLGLSARPRRASETNATPATLLEPCRPRVAPYSTSTVAQVSKQTPLASAITPMVARPPSPRSGPKTSTRRSERPDETLCTSS